MLFESGKNTGSSDRAGSGVTIELNEQEFLAVNRMSELRAQLPTIENEMNYHLWCKGSWSMHDLLKHLVGLCGPSHLLFSTWAIQETALREIIALKDACMLKSIKAVFDYKINDRKNEAFQLAQMNFTIVKLAKCHAKVCVLLGDNFQLTVCGSANFTRNQRWERYVVSVNPELAQLEAAHIDLIIAETIS